MTLVIAFPLAASFSGYKNSKFLGIVVFGYTCYRISGENKPMIILNKIWFYI